MKHALSMVLLIALTACGSLPSKEKALRIYQREHPERRVIAVEERREGEGFETKVYFDISYTTADDATQKRDSLRYHHVAEGWVRSPK